MAKKATSKTTGSKIVLTADLEKLAVTCIHDFAKDEKSGREATDNMSKHILRLAKEAEAKGGKDKKEELYVALCRHAETVYKQENMHGGKELPIKQLLPFWPVVKSQILAGMKSGIPMRTAKSAYDIVKQTPKTVRAGSNAGNDAGKVTVPKDIGAAIDKVYEAVKVIVLSHKDKTDALIAELNRCAAAITALAAVTPAESNEELPESKVA